MPKNKTKLLVFVAMVLFIVGGALASYWYVTNPKSKPGDLQASETTKKQTEIKDAEQAKSADNKNSNQQEQAQATTSQGKAGVSISSLGVSGQNLFVNALVSGTTSGSCKLVLSNGSNKIEKTAGVGLQVSYYICQGFSVPTSEVVPKGEWNALIELSSPDGSTKSETKKVTVQ